MNGRGDSHYLYCCPRCFTSWPLTDDVSAELLRSLDPADTAILARRAPTTDDAPTGCDYCRLLVQNAEQSAREGRRFLRKFLAFLLARRQCPESNRRHLTASRVVTPATGFDTPRSGCLAFCSVVKSVFRLIFGPIAFSCLAAWVGVGWYLAFGREAPSSTCWKTCQAPEFLEQALEVMIIPATVLISGAIVIMVYVKRMPPQQATKKHLHDLSEMAGLHAVITAIGIAIAVIFLSTDIRSDFMVYLAYCSYTIMGLAVIGLGRLTYCLSNAPTGVANDH